MKSATFLLALTLAAPACSKGQDQIPSTPALTPAPATAAGDPGAGAAAKNAALVGTVFERIDAATYSYLRLKTADGEVWAAVPATPVDVGASVTVVEPMKMSKFESKTLGRTFDLIYFGRLQGQEGAAPMGGGAMGGGQGDPQAAEALAAHGAPAPAAADVHVDKAEEGFSIAEIWAQKAELGGKQVIVRGKIVKYNANILGKNWIHLQDGTGDPTSATHDLAVTTKDEATVGDVVTVTGTLQLDQEFGAGYAYAAIVQDAKLTK